MSRRAAGPMSTVQGGRFGALAAPGARLTRVAMRTVRANYINLRGAEIIGSGS